MIVGAKIYLVLLKAELALEGAALRLGQGHGLLATLERQLRWVMMQSNSNYGKTEMTQVIARMTRVRENMYECRMSSAVVMRQR